MYDTCKSLPCAGAEAINPFGVKGMFRTSLIEARDRILN